MVVGDIAENAARKRQSLNTMLTHRVGTNFHKAVFAARFHHTGEQGVQLQRIGCGVRGRHLLIADAVHDGGEQPRLMSESGEKAVQQRHRGGFSVGAGDADQFQLAARVTEESIGHTSQRHGAVVDPDVADFVGKRGGQLLAKHRTCARLHSLRNIQVPVGLGAALGHIQSGNTLFFRVLDFAGIKFNPPDSDFGTAFDFAIVNVGY